MYRSLALQVPFAWARSARLPSCGRVLPRAIKSVLPLVLPKRHAREKCSQAYRVFTVSEKSWDVWVRGYIATITGMLDVQLHYNPFIAGAIEMKNTAALQTFL